MTGDGSIGADPGRVSAIIVHYRTPDLLRSCLESLRPAIERGLEVMVVDNRSEELFPTFIADDHPSVKVIANDHNLGYSRGINEGIARTRREFFLILNPDIRIRPGSIEALIESADAHPGAGIVAPRLLNPDGTLQYSCRRFYDFRTFLYRRTVLGKLHPDSPVVRRHMMFDYDHASPRVVDWVIGGAMLVRRSAVDEVGPMDERFFLYFEDVDWCYRMHQRGWSVVYEPAAEMYHHHRRESARRPLGRSFFSHLMSVLRFYEKWSLVLYLLKTQREEIGRALRFVVDLVAVNLGFVCAYLIRQALGDVLEKPVFGLSSYRNFWLFGNVLVIGSFYLLGFYRREPRGQDWVDRLFLVARGTGIVTVIMMATTFLIQAQESYSRVMVLLFWPLATGLLLAGRQLIAWFGASVRGRRLDLPRVAVAGTVDDVERARALLELRRDLGFEPVFLPGYVLGRGGAGGSGTGGEGPDDEGDPERFDRFLAFVRSERIASVYFVSPSRHPGKLSQMVPALARSGVRALLRPEFDAVLNPDVRVEDVGGSWVLALGTRSRWRAGGAGKRLIDVIGAIIGIVVGAPANLAYIAARRASARCPIFRTEERFVGAGTPVRYRMYAPRPRGNILQVIALDHYPRLFAVLKGDLSFVGVYPYRRSELEALAEPLRRLDLDAPPGVTGLWWFYRGTGLTPDRLRAMDVEYVQRWSNAYDLKTFLRSLTGLIRTRGHLPEPTSVTPDIPVDLASIREERS